MAMGDVDGDGLFDLFVTHLNYETNTLWKQVKRGQFARSNGPELGRAAPGAARASALFWRTSTRAGCRTRHG